MRNSNPEGLDHREGAGTQSTCAARGRWTIAAVLLSCLSVSCAQMGPWSGSTADKKGSSPAEDCAPQAYAGKLLTVGAIERVLLEPQGVVLEARIDTGAAVSSIDARDITPFERDGKRWVKFGLPLRDDSSRSLQIETPVTRRIRVKRHDRAAEERLVVTLRVLLGPANRLSEFTLADRSNYDYPVLIGRSYLQGLATVDVDRKLTLTPSSHPSRE